MKLILTLAGSAIILMGCATQQNKAPTEPIAVGPNPVCSSVDECQAMWAKATTVLPMITGMRLAMMNDIYMPKRPKIRWEMENTKYRQPSPAAIVVCVETYLSEGFSSLTRALTTRDWHLDL